MKPPDVSALTSSQLWDAEDLLEAAHVLGLPSPVPELERLRVFLRRASRSELTALSNQLAAQAAAMHRDAPQALQRDSRQRRARSGWTLRHELVRCGKHGCKCAEGEELHGAYWYGYRSVCGKTRKHYFGKKKPTAKEQAAALGKDSPSQLEHEILPKKSRAAFRKKGF